jgi:AcrR family transcriptional regulator
MARPRTFVEDDVVAAARDAFWSGGYSATSLDDLTAATGLGKGSLYGAFGDKHALFMRTLDEYCTSALDRLRDQLRGPAGGAYQRLTGYVRRLAAATAADTELRGCLMAKSAAELGSNDPEVNEKIGKTYTAMHAELTQAISEAQREGSLDQAADPGRLASLLLAVLRGIEALHKGGADDRTVADAAEQALELLPRAS